MRVGLFFLVVCISSKVFAIGKIQSTEGQIEGIVFDHDTKERVAKTNIVNLNTGKSFYNDLKGVFKIDAKAGDVLVFTKEDFLPDTVKLKSNANIIVYLQRTAIMLREVTVHDSVYNPLKQLEATRRAYSKAYGPNGNNDILSTSPGGGAGLSIDAIFNSFSRSGRNARHLQDAIQQDYQQNVINYRFNRSFVGHVTGLKDQELTDFMYKYRPGYYLVTTDDEYEFIIYIRSSLRRYLRNKRVYPLLPLEPTR